MFDVAYLPEASIEAARIEKNKMWKKILTLDLSKPMAGFTEMMYSAKCDTVIFYWGLIYYTHGGI